MTYWEGVKQVARDSWGWVKVHWIISTIVVAVIALIVLAGGITAAVATVKSWVVRSFISNYATGGNAGHLLAHGMEHAGWGGTVDRFIVPGDSRPRATHEHRDALFDPAKTSVETGVYTGVDPEALGEAQILARLNGAEPTLA